jgi:hypothetical protein
VGQNNRGQSEIKEPRLHIDQPIRASPYLLTQPLLKMATHFTNKIARSMLQECQEKSLQNHRQDQSFDSVQACTSSPRSE